MVKKVQKHLDKLDEIIETLYLEVLSRVSLGKFDNLGGFYKKRLDKIVSNLKQTLANNALFRHNTVLQRFIDAVLTKYITFWVVARILTTEQLYNTLPQFVLRVLSQFSGFDIGSLLNINAILMKFSQQILEFKDSLNVVNLILNWNFGFRLGYVCSVDLQFDQDDPLNISKTSLILVNEKTNQRIKLPVSLQNLIEDQKQLGIYGELLVSDNKKLNAELLRSTAQPIIRTNLISYLIQPYGKDLKSLAEQQSKLVLVLLYYGNKFKYKRIKSEILGCELSPLQLVIYYLALVELGNYLFDKKHNVTNKTRSFLKKTTFSLLQTDTVLKKPLQFVLTSIFRSYLNLPFSLVNKLATIYAYNLDTYLSVQSIDELWNLLLEDGNFNSEELQFLIPVQEKLFNVTNLLPILLEIYTNGEVLNERLNQDEVDYIENTPGISTDVLIAPVIHNNTELLDFLVLIKRLYDLQYIDEIAIFFTAELLLKELASELSIKLPYGLTLTQVFTLEPGTLFSKLLNWLKPIYTNFLALAVQLIGDNSSGILPLEDVYFDKLVQSFTDNQVSHSYASETNIELCQGSIDNWGSYITASNAFLQTFKIAISQPDSKQFFHSFLEETFKQLNLPRPENFYRSVNQFYLDGFGAYYYDITDSDFGDEKYDLIGYTEADRDIIDLVTFSEFDPETKTFVLKRVNLPPVLWERYV